MTTRGLAAYTQRIEHRLLALEGRIGLLPTALLLGLLLIVLGGLYAAENFVPFGFGTLYAELSIAPFDFTRPNIHQLRPLTPCIAHLLGLRGNAYPLLTHGASLLLLAGLYTTQRRGGAPADLAAGMTAMLAFSMTVLT